MIAIEIDTDDIESILKDFHEGYDSGLIDCYYVNAAYPKTTFDEREDALHATHRALTNALVKHGIARDDAVQYITRHEFHTRQTMNGVDELPVTPLPWLGFWAPMRWRHRDGMKKLWNAETKGEA